MEKMELLYKVSATDEFGRYFEVNAKIDGRLLVFKDQADKIYLQMTEQLVAHVLWRMGTEADAEWSVEVKDILD